MYTDYGLRCRPVCLVKFNVGMLRNDSTLFLYLSPNKYMGKGVNQVVFGIWDYKVFLTQKYILAYITFWIFIFFKVMLHFIVSLI